MEANNENPASELATLDLFVLAIIGFAGVRTLYALQQEVGLTSGGIRPALTKLQASGLLARAEKGHRQRREFAVTAAGHELLRERWSQAMRSLKLERTMASAEDLHAILRAAWVAIICAPPGQRREPLFWLSMAADVRSSEARKLQQDAADLGEHKVGSLDTYLWMRALCDGYRLQAEAEALRRVEHLLSEVQFNVRNLDQGERA